MIKMKLCNQVQLVFTFYSVSAKKRFLHLIINRRLDFVRNRMENEHLNNVGKYRAFNSVPLPFDYDEMAR